ncbi:glycosyltransferase [Paucilactobacillus hokkaidonensis]|uniref:glycosyltransferase n=1 Tax=Paucilactobacillus hokkaidonensis TaxID=1193095 RepID=UPI0006D11623|nr:glycosyltransferase [Paucilactobacillus hokkaidonensis]
MKILYVTTVSSTVNAFLIPHIEQLVKDGHQVDIACASNQPLDPQLEKLACKWNAIDFSRSTLSTNHLRSYQQMRHLFKQEHYDVVHTHTPIASFIVRLLAAIFQLRSFIPPMDFTFTVLPAAKIKSYFIH